MMDICEGPMRIRKLQGVQWRCPCEIKIPASILSCDKYYISGSTGCYFNTGLEGSGVLHKDWDDLYLILFQKEMFSNNTINSTNLLS